MIQEITERHRAKAQEKADIEQRVIYILFNPLSGNFAISHVKIPGEVKETFYPRQRQPSSPALRPAA